MKICGVYMAMSEKGKCRTETPELPLAVLLRRLQLGAKRYPYEPEHVNGLRAASEGEPPLPGSKGGVLD
jgi:hypothetical protein